MWQEMSESSLRSFSDNDETKSVREGAGGGDVTEEVCVWSARGRDTFFIGMPEVHRVKRDIKEKRWYGKDQGWQRAEPARRASRASRAEQNVARLVSLRANWRAEPRAEPGVGSTRLARGSARGSWKFYSIHFERIIAKIFHLYITIFHIIK